MMKKAVAAATVTATTLTLGCLALSGSAWAAPAQPSALPQVITGSPDLLHTNPQMMITPQQALAWATMKSALGPTYNGGAGGIPWYNFLFSTAQQFGGVDFFTQSLPYNLYTVNDWPNPLTHIFGSGVEVLKMISNGTPVATVASYGMTSGATPTTGLTAQMVYCPSTTSASGSVTTTCPGNITGKIAVCSPSPYPAAVPNSNGPYAYSSSILQLYAYTDAEARFESNPPGNFPLWTAVPPTVQTSHYYRWQFSMQSSCQSAGQKGGAAGEVWVYDLSPGGAFGLLERSVYSAAGSPAAGGPGTIYQNMPTLALDRVNGAKVIADAQAGATATMWLLPQGVTDSCSSTAATANGSPSCGFVPVQGKYFVAYIPGKYYGTPQDQYINIATHIDAQSLVEEDGGFGLLTMMNYFNQIPQSQRPKTLQFWFDGRHFMPGAEGQWSIYDYFNLNPSKKTPVVAYMSLEHIGGRATQETGTPDGLGADTYSYINAAPEDGGDIDSLITLSNNNLWLINAANQAAKDNNWVRMFAASGPVQPGMLGGYQKSVNSAELKGSPGVGLAGDWPGNWTQSYSQLTTEAGCPTPTTCSQIPGWDANAFVSTTGGMTGLAGVMMAQTNLKIVLDLGWGSIASGILCTTSAICVTTPTSGQLPDTAFKSSGSASTQRAALFSQYQTAFQYVQQGQYRQAINALQTLEQNVTSFVSSPTALNVLIGNQITKLLAQPPVYSHDFNGDGLSDVLWRDSSGDVGMWLMNGTSVLQTKVIANAPSNWSIVGQRDFNGDGNADLLWRDNSGNVGIWLMSGSSIGSTAVLGNVASNWSVVGTGDFNGDGNGDILWRDNLGNLAIWFMNGTQVIQSAVVGNVPTSWAVAGADMLGDIFWRNSGTGDVGMWVMNGTKVSSTTDLGVVPSTWSIAAVGDFDNNGSTDLLWRDTSGNVGMWLMNGTAVLSTSVVGNVPSNWTLTNTGDYNGDGKSDVMWTDNLGNVGVWLMDGATISTTSTLANIGTAWSAQVANAN
jgi:hypothetical protein